MTLECVNARRRVQVEDKYLSVSRSYCESLVREIDGEHGVETHHQIQKTRAIGECGLSKSGDVRMKRLYNCLDERRQFRVEVRSVQLDESSNDDEHLGVLTERLDVCARLRRRGKRRGWGRSDERIRAQRQNALQCASIQTLHVSC